MKKYLSNEIKREIIGAPPDSVIILHAPAGCGKTTFALSELKDHLKLNNQNLLYVVNRQTLRAQIMHLMLDRYGIDCTDLAKRGWIAFDNVTIVSYQFLGKSQRRFSRSPERTATEGEKQPYPLPLDISVYDVIFFDEAHYLLSDALFNPDIDTFVNHSSIRAPLFCGKKRIYASATINDAVRDAIFQAEFISRTEKAGNGTHYYQAYLLHEIERCVMELNGGEADYSYLTPAVVDGSSSEKIADDIEQRCKDGLTKALVFVDSIKKGKELEDLLSEKKITSAFIFSESSSGQELSLTSKEALERLYTKESFEETVFISTTVIDNGVNIKDSSVTHIYPAGIDPVSLVQQVGRVRISPKKEQKITLVLRKCNLNELKNRKAEYEKRITVVDDFNHADREKRISMLMDEKTQEDLRVCACTNYYGATVLSAFARPALVYQRRLYEDALKRAEQNDLEAQIFRLFDIEYSENDSSQISLEELEQFVLDNKNVSFHKDEDKEFREEFRKRYEKATGKCMCNGRKDRLPGPQAINAIISNFGMIFKTKDGVATITEKPKE